jgi:TRAP-type C4-dicarboxylate transport system substrate-binding protein
MKSIMHMAVAAGLLAAAGAAEAQTPTVTLRFNSFAPSTEEATGITFPKFIREVEADSGGTLKIDLFPGGGLGRDPVAQLKLVTDGVADIALILASNTPGRFPDEEIVEVPFLVNSGEEGGALMWRLFKKGLLRGYDKLEVFGIGGSPPYAIHSTFPVKKPADLVGKKMRGGGRLHGETLKALGATPVGIPAPLVAENIAKHVIDGTLLSLHGAVAFRVADAAKNHFINPMGAVTIFVAMRKDKFDELPAQPKAALNKRIGENFSREMGRVQDEAATKALAAFKADPSRSVVIPNEAEQREWRTKLDAVTKNWIATHDRGKELWEAANRELEAIRKGS